MSDYKQITSFVKHPHWTKDKTIYEINLRQYSDGGSFREFSSHLPRLKKLGVGILWFMPIHPVGIKNRKGNLGSQYSVRSYKAIDPMYGTLSEFKDLVDKIHESGMYIIMDWVANHTAWDHHWTHSHPEFYTKDQNGDFKAPEPEWEDVIELNYENKLLWQEMIDAMRYWIEDFDIDGFRCDMAHLVPTSFWNEARKQLNKSKHVFMLAESENRDLVVEAFDAIYNWNIHHLMNGIAKNEQKISNLDLMLEYEIFKFPKYAYQMLFTSNHDENSWHGSAIERLHYGLEAFNVLSFTLPGIPLIYNGQEAGNFKQLSFFEKDVIQWKQDKMTPFYQKLIDLKKRNAALWNGEYGGYFTKIHTSNNESILAFLREKEDEKILVIINFSNQNHSFTLYGNEYAGYYIELFQKQEYTLYMNQTFNLAPWAYNVFEKI